MPVRKLPIEEPVFVGEGEEDVLFRRLRPREEVLSW
jgi:hypothetical protein